MFNDAMRQGEGKYLEGGKEAGGQLVDQRFCPRIVEGTGHGEGTRCRSYC